MKYEILLLPINPNIYNLVIILFEINKEELVDIVIRKKLLFLILKNNIKKKIKIDLKDKVISEVFIINNKDFLKDKLDAEAFIKKI